MLQYLKNRSVSIGFTMDEQDQQEHIQKLQIPKDLSLSNKLLQKMKTLQFLQLNNHFSLIIIIHTLKVLSIVHLALSYLSIDSQPLAVLIQNDPFSVNSQFAVYRTLQILIYFLKVVKIVTLGIAVRGERDSLIYKAAKRVVKYIIILSEADLILTSLLLLINFKENIAGFIISALVNIVLNIELDNYTNRRLESYQSSQIGGLVYRCIHIFLYFINSTLSCIGIASYYYIFNLIFGVLVFKWYLSSGITLYYHLRPKYFTMTFISFYLTFIYLLAERLVLKTVIFDISHIAQYIIILFFLFVFLFLYSEYNKVQYKSISSTSQVVKNIKEIDLGCFDLVRAGTPDFDADSYLSGLFKYHQDQNCSNSKCYIRKDTYYDPMCKKRFNINEVSKEKESNLRFYLKCLYQQCLQNHPSQQLLLDYCQFLVGEYFDLYHINKLFAKIELCHLSFFDSLRLYRLKIAVKEEATSLNRLIFDGKMQIEKIMKADETFQEVNEKINQYLTKSIAAWTSINRNEVNLTQLKATFKAIFVMLNSINKSWTPLNPYLTLQKKWRFLRMSYSHYILNEKVRQKNIDKSELSEDRDYDKENSYVEPGEKEDRLFNKELLFDKNALYLHTAIENKTMYILRTNQRFQEISMYSSNQIRGAEVDEFLPEDIKKAHNKSVMTWLEKGQSNNQSCYPVRFTELKTKEGELVPVIKYFKILVNVQASKEDYLHFVCMLKVNQKNVPSQQQPNYSCTRSVVANFFSDTVGKRSLKVQSNPFLKQESLKPKSKMQELSKIKASMRVLITILVLMTFGLYLLTSQDANNLNDYSIQYINFLNLYRYPMAFGKNILKTMLNVGNQTKAIGQINLEIIQITALMSDPMTLQSIFDPSLNIPKMYYPFQNNSFNKGIGYNQIDLIYYMVSTIQSLNKLPANRTGEYFTNFNMYITPYENLINSTKIRFHGSFKDIFGSMINNQIVFLVTEISIFVLGMVYISYEVYQYFKKTKDNIKTIIQFNDEEVRKIISYYKQLQLYLCNFSYQQPVKGVSRQMSDLQLTEEVMLKARESRRNEISLNKKSKYIYQPKQEIVRTIKYIVIITVLMSVVLISISSFEIANMITINAIQSFEEDGFYFLRYFPATSVLGHAILEKYYSQVYPLEITFHPQRYAESISDLTLIGHAEYIGNVLFPESLYFQDQKNYLFGNPCTTNPSVLIDAQTSQSKCLTIYNKTFSLGITTFLRTCEKQINDFLNGKLKLSSSQIDELTSALTLVAYYITDAIMTWSSELTTMIMDFNSHNAILCLIICSGLLIFHVLSCQCMLFTHLEEDYCFSRKVFEHMVPQQILINEKVIKQKFIINGILHHQ